jgi:hypothetical protein
MSKQSKEEWERNINRFIKSDSRKRLNLTPSVQDAMHALDQMKAVDGKTPFETHPQLGLLAGAIMEKRFGVGDRWDKQYEYRIFLKDSLLQEDTCPNPEMIMKEEEWMAVEAYAVEEIGIKEDIVYKGNLFRKEYLGCSKRMGCVKIERASDGSGSSMILTTPVEQNARTNQQRKQVSSPKKKLILSGE